MFKSGNTAMRYFGHFVCLAELGTLSDVQFFLPFYLPFSQCEPGSCA